MGLVYGEPGLGKSRAVLWWAMQNDAVFIRSANLMTGVKYHPVLVNVS